MTVSDLLSVLLLVPSPSRIGRVGRWILWDDFASDSAPSSVQHGASPSAPTHITKSSRFVAILQCKCIIICIFSFYQLQLSFPFHTSRCHCHENDQLLVQLKLLWFANVKLLSRWMWVSVTDPNNCVWLWTCFCWQRCWWEPAAAWKGRPSLASLLSWSKWKVVDMLHSGHSRFAIVIKFVWVRVAMFDTIWQKKSDQGVKASISDWEKGENWKKTGSNFDKGTKLNWVRWNWAQIKTCCSSRLTTELHTCLSHIVTNQKSFCRKSISLQWE